MAIFGKFHNLDRDPFPFGFQFSNAGEGDRRLDVAAGLLLLVAIIPEIDAADAIL
jgi:hypothetical protein